MHHDACLAVAICRHRGRQQRAASLLRAMESSGEDTALPGHRRPVLTQEQEHLVEQLLAQVGFAGGAASCTSGARVSARQAQSCGPHCIILQQVYGKESRCMKYLHQPHCFMQYELGHGFRLRPPAAAAGSGEF